MCRRRQCVRSQTVTRKSHYGLVREASNPGPPRTRARVRMEQEAEAEATLSCLEAAVTRIDDSDDEPLATWRDEVSESEEMGRGADVRNVWARAGDVETHATLAPTLLDSLAQDLFGGKWRTSVTTKLLLNGTRCLVPHLSLMQSPGLMVSIVTGSGSISEGIQEETVVLESTRDGCSIVSVTQPVRSIG